MLRETRSGAWSSINRFDTDPAELTRHYLTLWFDHGVDPEDASYAYVLLPNKTAAEVKQYTAKPGIVILENSAEAHAVRQNERNTTGINVWIDGGKKVGDLWVDRKSSVMLMENEDQLELAVADPTFRQTSAIQMEIDKEAESVLFRDPAVTIVRLRPTIRLTVDVRGAGGKTFRAAFKTGKLKDGKENKFTEQQ